MVNQTEGKGEEKDWLKVADRLEELQRGLNGGQGSNLVRIIADLLREGRSKEAIAWCETDHDKFRQYPEVRAYMMEAGLMPEMKALEARQAKFYR